MSVANVKCHGSSYAMHFKSARTKNNFLIAQPKHILWGLNETVLLNTQNIC